MLLRNLFVLLLGASGLVNAFAQGPPPIGAISGIVINADNSLPLQGAIVKAFQDGDEIWRDTTDLGGLFSMSEMQLGAYDVEASHTGFVTQTETGIEVFPDQTTTVNFGLHHTCVYITGDANGNGAFNGIDVTYGVSYFKGGQPPPYTCYCDGHTWFVAGDTNGDCVYNGLDITYGVSYFKGGPAIHPCPACPGLR